MRLHSLSAAAAVVLTIAAAWTVRPQTAALTFHGYRGETQIWVDRMTIEKGRIEDRIDGMGDQPDREATTLPGTLEGEIFSEQAAGVPGHRVVIQGGFVTVYRGPATDGMLALEGKPLVFDPTIPSHYAMLLDRYDAGRGGPQKITVIVPEKGDYCPVEISPRPPVAIHVSGPEGAAGAAKTAKVYQFRLDYNRFLTVWTLDAAVAAVYVPWTDETMVDARYPGLHRTIQMLVKRST